jgi:amino acid adenylation domain-containing protein
MFKDPTALSGSEAAGGVGVCLQDLFEAAVDRAPEAVALSFGGLNLSYRDLNIRANRLAHALRRLGIGPEDRVAICAERGPDLVATMLGVLKAGAAYVPLDPASPAERLGWIVEDSGSRLILTEPRWKVLFDGTSAPVLPLTGRGTLELGDDDNLLRAETGLTSSNLAYVIYTSGSTGRPKGVLVEHGNVVNLTHHFSLQARVRADDRVLQFASFSFDASVSEIFPTLWAGATLVLRPNGPVPPLKAFVDFMVEERVSICDLPIALFTQWAAALAEDQSLAPPAALRQVVLGGEALDPGALNRWFQGARHAPSRIVHVYGPTEAAVQVTAIEYESDSWVEIDEVPIGLPVANTTIHLLDADGRPVGPGETGEIHIGGVQVARGYLDQPELTAERFVVDPFSTTPGARLYRTGDLGRLAPGGEVVFVGRIDSQVKIRGYRIELGEIEACLTRHPRVADAVLVVVGAEDGDPRLAAYFTSTELGAAPVQDAELREHLRRSLPDYMTPAIFMPLDRFPLTINGKVDLKALPAPSATDLALGADDAPRGELEVLTAQIWRDVLKTGPIGRQDNFFQRGGHSLSLMRVLEALRRAGWTLDIGAFYRNPTVVGVAMAARPTPSPSDSATREATKPFALSGLSQAEISGVLASAPGGPDNVLDLYPLTPLQQGMLFHAVAAERIDPYAIVSIVRFNNRAVLDGYVAALEAVTRRHDVFRTAFLWEGLSEPTQLVLRDATLRIDEVSLDGGDIVEQLMALARSPAYALDIAAAPLQRLLIAQDPVSGDWWMASLLHHLIGDHASEQLIDAEIAEHFAGRADALEPPVPFRAFLEHRRDALDPIAQEAFFKAMLGDVDEPTAPFNCLETDFVPDDIEDEVLELDADLSRHIRARCEALGVSPAAFFHLAWALITAKTTGRRDVVFGTVMLGRLGGAPGADRALGLFMNTLPYRFDGFDLAAAPALKTVAAALEALIPHEQVSLALAQRSSGVPASAPLFTSLLNYAHDSADNAHQHAGRRDPVPGMTTHRVYERTNYPVTLTIEARGGRHCLIVNAPRSVGARRLGQIVQAAISSLEAALATASDQAVGALDVLPEAERDILLDAWNDTEADAPSARCVHALFEDQAARTADKIAVVGQDASLTYGELNARANQLAHHLIDLGVRPDDRVALCLDRSPEMVTAILGVLKSGGAYVPLDPAHPVDRLRAMLVDSGATILVVNGPSPLSGETHPALRIVDLASSPSNPSPENLDPARVGVRPDHLAYVLYTSGSTGAPKGVTIEHRNVTNLITHYSAEARIGPDDRVMQFASYGFDVSVEEIFLSLWTGATIVLRPLALRSPDASFVAFLRQHRISVAFLPTAFWHQWVAELAEDHALVPPSGLREVLVAGEKLERRHLVAWREHVEACRVVNAYGPTEAAVVTAMEYDATKPLPAHEVPIGRPVANTTLYILDAAGQPTPIGVAGELYIGGVQVARGYLNRPDLTAERFLPDPFVPGGRLYKTGDLARYLPGGDVEYLGRNDFQVKIRGFRVELGEIEARLAYHLAVREAVVLAREDQPGLKRLVAYYTPAADQEPASAPLLRAHLLAALPEHMVPAAFVALPALPLTPNGKIDRKALPAPDGEAFAARLHQAPQGSTEQAVAQAWSQVLGLEAIGRDDNFFELGGHSLLVVKVVNRLKVLAPKLSPVDLFKHQTLAALAGHIDTLGQAGGPTASRVVARNPNGQPAPLTSAQQSLWFLAQAQGASQAYHIPLTLRLTGALDVAALARALDGVVARHEALRTTFSLIDGAPAQSVAATVSLELRREALAADASLAQAITDTIAASFDLQSGPPIRARLLGLGDQEHVLILVLHHIAADGWSMQVLQDELSSLYDAFVAGAADPLPPLAIQSADYALLQAETRNGGDGQDLARYWKTALAGAPALLNLPLDRPRPAIQDHAGAFAPIVVGTALSKDLAALAKRRGVTLHTIALAAWALVLSRLSGQDEVVIGTPSAGRDRPELHGLIGYFVNTLPLRVDLATSQTGQALIDQVQRVVLAGLQHQDLAFPGIIEAVRPARDPAHNPLFQTLLTLEQAGDSPAWTLAGLEVEVLADGDRDTAKVDLTLALTVKADAITGGLEYATALFDPTTANRIGGYVLAALEALARDESQPLAKVDLLSPTERGQLLVDWNDTARDYPRDRCIHELFEDQVDRAPDAVALVFEDQSLTYGQLNARANQLAHHLIDLGVQPDDRVALCLERSADMVVAILATLKAGGAYVPLDPAYPDTRLTWMLQDAQPRVVLTSRELAGRISAAGQPVVTLEPGAQAFADQPVSNPDRRAAGLTSEHLAYVIYTSGSTGHPKGVMVTHRNVLRLVVNNPYAPLTSDDCVAHCASPAFDAATWEIWSALLNGARLLIVPPATVLAPGRLNTVLAQGGVSALWLTAGLFNEYVDLLPDTFAGLRHLLVGGDVLNPTTIRRLLASDHRPGRLINGYGPTETTTFATTHLIGDDLPAGASTPIGRPIANTTLYILNAAGQPTPIGVAGELHIGGDGVARGYLNRPDLTAERFLPDPFVPGGRLYKTGDLARYLPSGDVEYLGRNDFQVKIRGFRVELGEIEARLADHPAVREAVVLAREDQPGLKRLVAYYTSAADQEPASAPLLRAHLLAALPEHMVPAAFVALPVLPLTPNGKIDRKALPAPDGEAFAARLHQAPQGSTEQAVAQAWSQVLGLEAIGRDDNFFELGGHSLLVVRLVHKLKDRSPALQPIDLFKHQTLAALADYIDVLDAQAVQAPPPIAPRSHAEPAPLSLAQQSLWFVAQTQSASRAYHIPLTLRLIGDLDATALNRALNQIVARHAALRTRFTLVDGAPVQLAAPELRLDLGYEPCLAGADLDKAIANIIAAPFDLETGPLIRARLLAQGPTDHTLVLVLHHIIADGWSMGVLRDELASLYEAFSAGLPDPLEPLALSYADYAAWQGERLDDAGATGLVEHWKAALAGAPTLLELPLDRPRPLVQDHAGAFTPLTVATDLTAGLLALGQRRGVSLHTIALAAWALVLSRLSGQDEVVVGSPSAGRDHPQTQGLIGYFVNTLPLRVSLDSAATIQTLLDQVRDHVLAAVRHQDLSLPRIIALTEPNRDPAYNPLFQTMLTLEQFQGEAPWALAGLDVTDLGDSDHDTAKVDLTLALTLKDGAITGGVEYATALFAPDTIERVRDYVLAVFQAMARDETTVLADISILSQAERQTLLVDWNDTAADYPADLCVHELFEAQVASTPDAVATSFRDQALTYGQLDACANQLAHHLISLGIGPDDRVALCFERSPEMLVGLLATLKAGGAYVPLDPTYPRERLHGMLDDCGAKIVLTHEAVDASVWAVDPLGGESVPVLDLRRDATTWAGASQAAPSRAETDLRPNHLAYVIYTSGSTGTPKGVMIEHANVTNYLWWARQAYGLTPGGLTPVNTSFAFDATVTSLLVPLVSGGQVLLLDQGDQELDQLGRLLAEGPDCAIVKLTPAHLDVLDQLHPRAARQGAAGALVIGGEALTARQIARWRASAPGVRLINEYGPTEATVGATIFEDAPQSPIAGGLPIGRPIANTRIYILDAALTPVPRGTTGEIYIGGAGVGRGYLNRPDLTKERFIASPFVAGDRLYRTGDLARYLPSGDIEYLGRNDGQVKIRGFRIELGEIETRLEGHPDVREAVVLAREDQPGHKRLVAYYTAVAAIDVESLRGHLLAALPEHMVPAAFVALPVLPLTPNGKIDRKALPAPDAAAFPSRDETPPQGSTEQAIARAWTQALGLETVGRHDNFFALGGHSLLAVRVVAGLRPLAPNLAPVDLFRHQTLSGLADHIDRQVHQAQQHPPIAPRRQAGPAPLSLAQQSLWFVAQMEGAGQAYHVPLALRLKGDLDLEALQRALDRILARHEILRTGFTLVDGVPVQVARQSQILNVVRAPIGEADLQSVIGGIVAEPFDLETDALIRARLLQVADQDHVLILVLHHIVSDGWSMDLLREELAALYAAFVNGQPDPLPPLPIQYADYAVWQRRRGADDGEADLAKSWKAALAGAPDLLELPLDQPRPAVQDHAGAFAPMTLDPALTQGLLALAQERGATLHALALAAWALVLGRLSGQDEVVIGTPSAGRDHPQTHGLIGYFVNTLPLRVSLDPTASLSALVDKVREQVLSALQRQDLALPQILQAVSPTRSPAYNPLFQTLLTVEQDDAQDWNLPGLNVEPLAEIGQTKAKVDLTLSLVLKGGEITGGVEYATALFDPATVSRLQGHLLAVFQTMIEKPDAPLGQVDILSQAERRTLLVDWNATNAEDRPDRCVHTLFEDQVARDPDALAVVGEETSLTYGQLNARADQLAQHLVELGVKPDDRVALCLRRSPDMIVAILAALKAGGAYVPLDPAYPAERLNWMLRDSGAQVLVACPDLATLLLKDAGHVRLVDPARFDGRPLAVPLPPTGVTSANLAYVIYTSGSTGAPKGVMVEHRNLANTLVQQRREGRVLQNDRVLQFASYGFDISAEEIFSTLWAGATLVLRPADFVGVDAAFVDWLERARITAAFLPTAVWRQWTTSLAEDPGLAPPKTLRRVMIGGEKADLRDLRIWRAHAGESRLINAYGPTEATIMATTITYDAATPLPAHEVPIGRPVANTTLYILDAAGQPTPIGVAGELYIGGVQVARGYLNRPDLTAERFLPDPFVPRGRLYKTGDLARYLPGGDVEYLGRNDFQVKIRGFRVELGEIEARLADHLAVREAVVLAREDQPSLKRLVAYYTSAADQEPASAPLLRAHLLAALPEHMVPAAFVALPALPLTPNGKIDRKALPAPDGEAFAARLHQAPQGSTEQAVAQAWSLVLGLETVGRDDNFFELGGHSLLVVKVVNRLKVLAPKLSPVDLFKHQTLAALAGHVDALGQGMGSGDPFEIRRGGAKTRLFLVHDGGGQLMYAPGLALTLDSERSVWGLPARPLTASHDETVRSLAAAQVERLRAIQPTGPYGLGGHSFGGLIAYEMAVQLRAAGQSVAFVVMLDTVHPGGASGSEGRWRGDVREALDWSQIAQGDEDIAAFYALAARAASNYRPPPLDVPVHLMVAQDAGHDEPRLGWPGKAGVGAVRTHRVDGDHFTLLAPAHVAKLGRSIERALDETAATWPSGSAARAGDVQSARHARDGHDQMSLLEDG